MSGSTDHVRKNRVHWEGESAVYQERNARHSIRLFRANGLIIEDLLELQPAPDADTTYTDYTTLEWARAFPSEHIWKVRKASGVPS